MSFRLAKSHRLLKSQDFKQVFDRAELKAGSRSLLLLGSSTDLGHTRLGLVISKKNVGAAVQRNRLKRLGREVFRCRSRDLPSIDVVFLARPGLGSLSNPEILVLMNKLIDTLIEQHRRHIDSGGIPDISC